jgi:hypothetical protein
MISKVKPVVKDTGDNSDWFQSWFDSPYYFSYYKDRDENSANLFLEKILQKINLSAGAKVLDAACKRAVHSIFLNKKGFDVTGFDSSSTNILHDKQFENEMLNFYLHDIREVFRSNYFHLAFGFNSSFGYYSKERDNERCLIANAISLKPGGVFVLDYLNAAVVRSADDKNYSRNSDGITFHVREYVEGDFVRKEISFHDRGDDHKFLEQFALYDRTQIERMLRGAGLVTSFVYGNYELDEFHSNNSERLIVVARKIESS